MSIFCDENTRVIVQGTGQAGTYHATQCKDYGTRIVAGVAPGKGGQDFLGQPTFDTMREAVAATGANCSLIFVPAPFAADALLEAVDAEIALIICITEGIPALDMVRVRRAAGGRPSRIIGPNCPGVISPGKAKIGIMPGYIHRPGAVGVVSRSGTLTYETVHQLTRLGLGQSTCVGIGGDPVVGTSFVEVLEAFADDPDTQAVVMIGEIGGAGEEAAAATIKDRLRQKPVVAFIAGQTAPPGKRMGHAGAIIAGGHGAATQKIAALQDAGARIAPNPNEIGSTLAALL
ncbi:MAG: succinate--CoA ligase subunit alpha [Proteobacteria bacterium]|nr:succinate--CoA ligase subunit alpha [Pseudomonadota bacterium]